jgi:hypothetical protein
LQEAVHAVHRDVFDRLARSGRDAEAEREVDEGVAAVAADVQLAVQDSEAKPRARVVAAVAERGDGDVSGIERTSRIGTEEARIGQVGPVVEHLVAGSDGLTGK